jgi:hypothetical protein
MGQVRIDARIALATFAGLLAFTSAASSQSQPVRRQGACGAIRAACEAAGFSPGSGLQAGCIVPIIQGKPPRRAGNPLPQIDPQQVADCKTENPRFGQGRLPPTTSEPTPPPDNGKP